MLDELTIELKTYNIKSTYEFTLKTAINLRDFYYFLTKYLGISF